MSKMKELYEKVAGDSALRDKFAEIMKGAEETGEKATLEKLEAFAKDAGAEVTLDEMRQFFRELTAQKEGSLSEAELDLVAGGKGEEVVISAMFFLTGMCFDQ